MLDACHSRLDASSLGLWALSKMGFPVLKNLGCMSLKCGCLIIGIFGIIVSVIALFLFLFMLLALWLAPLYNSTAWDVIISSQGYDPKGRYYRNYQDIEGKPKDAATVGIIGITVFGVIILGDMITSCILVHGVRKDAPGLFTPFLIWAPFVLLLWMINLIVPPILIDTFHYDKIAPIIIWICVVGFFWVVVYSHRKEIFDPNYPRVGAGVVHYSVQQPGIQYNAHQPGVQYNTQQPGVQYNVQQQGVQYNVPPQGVQYIVQQPGVQYNMPPQSV